MLPSSFERILDEVGDGQLVLDVGGWAKPLSRADWVLDLMPYETRGLYGGDDGGKERFTRDTWIVRDVCDREPWPFEDGRFDFAVCSHTLEDIRDPVWVCSELARVARAGYIEVPSRVQEQCWGVHGPWVGWSHHRWLIDRFDEGLEFVLKPGVLNGGPEFHFPAGIAQALTDVERVETLFWEGSFDYRERIFFEPDELNRYLASLVAERLPHYSSRLPSSRIARARARAKTMLARARREL